MKVAIILCCLFAVAFAAKLGGKPEAKPAAESKANANGKAAETKADAKAAADVKANSKSAASPAAAPAPAAAAAHAAEAKDDKEDSVQAQVMMAEPETKTNAESNEYNLSVQEQEAKKNNVYAPVYDARPVSYGPSYNAPAPPAYRPPVPSYNTQNSYTAPQYGQNNVYQSGNSYNAPNNYPPNDCKKTAILRKINEKVSKALENSKTACANVELLSNIKSLVNLALLNNCNNGYKAEGQHQGKMAAGEGQGRPVEHLKKNFQSKSGSKKNFFHSKSAKE